MKKKIVKGVFSISLVMVMAYGAYSKNAQEKPLVLLDNVEALACFDLNENGSSAGKCCAPWYNTCYMVDAYNHVKGTRSY